MSLKGSPRSESSLPPYEVPLLATVSPRRTPPTSDALDFSTKRPASPLRSPPAAMNLSNSNDDSPIDLTIRSKKIKLEPSIMMPSNDAHGRMIRPWTQYPLHVPRAEMMTSPSDQIHMWNGKHGKMPPYGAFPGAGSDATKALEKMCELSKLQDEPRSVLTPSSGRHSAWQSHWLNKGADQTKDVLKCVWCKMSFPTLQAMSAHMAETKHGTAAQSLQPPPPPPPPPPSVSASSGGHNKNDINMLVKETMTLPRKLVRGQDVWLGKGAEQTRQILKCMWCGQSFRSLQEMTTHMQQTQHYTNIISQEQIISWKSADENKSSSSASGSNNTSSGGAASSSSPAGSGSVNTSANHVSAVLTCKVCDQAFNSLKELSVHMVKNSHYKEHMMRSITEGSNRRRQTREKRKKSLPVRKLLELERAQHEVKNGDGGYGAGAGGPGFKSMNDTNHRLGRIICEKCGEKVDVASFMEHLRVCVTMTADQKNLLKTALMSQNALSSSSSSLSPDGPGRGEKRQKREDRSHVTAAADLSMNKPAAAAATTGGGGTSSPSVLNAIEKLIEKSFDSRLRYGTSAAGASIGESILKRLGIDESVDATKPIMDMQAMNLLRSYQSLGRHERSGSESSSMSPELAAMRSDSTTPDRKYETGDYQRMRSVTPKSTPERHHSPKSSSGKNHQDVDAVVKTESVATDDAEFEVKKEYVDDDRDVAKSPVEQQQRAIRSRESAEGSVVADDMNGSSRGPTPTSVVKSSPPSPAGSDKSSVTDTGSSSKKMTSSLGALSSMFESLTSAANAAGGGSSSTANGDAGSGGKSGGGGVSSHPLAALQKLCDKTENHHHPHHHRPSSRSSSNASATNGGATGPAQSMSPPTSITGSTAPGAILAFSWACNDAVMTADSIMKCAFCDTPFISKGAYRHHLSKVHFVKEGITPEPIMLKPASAAAASGQPSSSSSTAHSPSPSPSSSSQNKSSPNHGNNGNNNNNNNNNSNNNNNGSPSTSGGGGAKSPETKNSGYDESPHSKFLKYTELAKQLSSKYV